jgi:ADP-ribosyl-[dinitrogen reductase] hydrolase
VIDDPHSPTPSERFTGCLLGLAIGDALGMAGEGRRAGGPIRGYEPLLDADGNEREPAGQFSSHTELALCLVETLVTANGFIDPDSAGYRFLQVLQSEHGHFLDETTRSALERASETGDFQAGAGADPVAPGPAARIAPVALVHALGRVNPELLVREVMRATLLTHAQPEAVNGALAMAYALTLVARREVPPELLIAEVLSFIDEDDIARALRVAAAALADAFADTDAPARIGGGGIAPAVATALYLFARHHDDFETAVLAAANVPCSPAAVGAMTGALAGAWRGARALPLDLVEGLEGRMYILMAAPALYRTAQRRAGLFLQLHQRP